MNNTSQNEQTWVLLCHLSSLAMLLGIPFANVIGPLIIWLLKKDQFPSVDAHGKESLNFQISMSIYALVAGTILCLLGWFVILPVLIVVNVVLVIIASVKASRGEFYRYPLTIRFVT